MGDGNQTIVASDHSGVTIGATDSAPRSPSRERGRRLVSRRLALGAATTAALVVLGVACGADGDDTASTQQLSEQAQRGLAVMNQNGCAACHGTDWNGGTGPPLVGLFGTERTLVDGSTVIADEDYLTLAIAEPAAQMLEGWSLRMPANGLDDEQIADVVEFIREVGPATDDTVNGTGTGTGAGAGDGAGAGESGDG